MERICMALPKCDGHAIVFVPYYTMEKDAEFILYSYNNHDYEFEDLDEGMTAIDLLLDNLDNDAAAHCLDVG